MNISMINPFPCYIGEVILDIDDTTHQGLMDTIEQVGTHVSEENISFSSYFHMPSVHNMNEHFAVLSNKIVEASNVYYRKLKNVNESIDTLQMQRMWINIFKQHGYTTFHDHWETPFSYTFYMDNYDSPLKFMHPSQVKSTNFHFIKPARHKLLIWPGYLMHEIVPNREPVERLSIAGKLNWTQLWLTPDGRPHDNDPLDPPREF